MKTSRIYVLALTLATAILTLQSTAQAGRLKAQASTPMSTQAATSAPVSFEPTTLKKIVSDLNTAVQGKVDDPSKIRLAIVVNLLSPFWTAAAIGEQRASSELGAPVVFDAPNLKDKIGSQQSILQSMVVDQYSGIALSAVDPASVVDIIKMGMAANTNFVLVDSDSPNSGRPLFLGLNNYNGGVLAAKAMVSALNNGDKCGDVIGFVGFATAQNAIDRIQGIRDTFKGTKCTFNTVLVDNGDPKTALSNAESAITNYPNAVGFIGLYSYNGPAIGQAITLANKIGQIKLVSFDLEPGTIKQLKANPSPVSAAIGQRVYYYGYLTTYLLYSLSAIGKDATLKVLDPYLSGNKHDSIDAGADIVTPNTLPAYQQYLNTLGIRSQ